MIKLTVGKVVNAVSVIDTPKDAVFDATIGEAIDCRTIMHVRESVADIRSIFPASIPDDVLAHFIESCKKDGSRNPANKVKTVVESGLFDKWLGRGVQAVALIGQAVDVLSKAGVFSSHQ